MVSEQTLKEYLDNPMGKGSTAIANRTLIRDDLDRRYFALLKKHKDFKYTVYVEGYNYYFHFLIPSETDRENTYDVVINLTEGDGENLRNDNFLYRYKLKFFSNCPSFTYTYAYVAFKNNRLINFLGKKYDREVVTKEPIIRNPGEILNYEKSVYFACKYLLEHRQLMNKMNLKPIAKKLKREELKSLIRTDEKIQLEIKKENNRLSNLKKENKNSTATKSSTTNKVTGKDKIKGAVRPPTSASGKKITPRKKITPKKSSVKR